MRLRWMAIALLPVALGCREEACVHYEDISLVDRKGVATPEQHQPVRDTVARFHAWTQRDTLCVSEIVFTTDIAAIRFQQGGAQEEPNEELTGFIRDDHIFLDPSRDPGGLEQERTTMRELCHAFDFHTNLVDLGEGLFGEPLGNFGESNVARHPGEQFAQFCESGPVAVATANAGACRPEQELLLLVELVYPGNGSPYRFNDSAVLGKRVMTGVPRHDGRAWAADDLVLVQRSELNDALDFAPFAAIGAAGEVEPFGATHTFPGGVGAYLLDASPNPPVLAPYGEPLLAPVRLGADGTSANLRYPTPVSKIDRGVVIGDIALLGAALDGVVGNYHRVDLRGGTAAPWLPPVEGSSLSRLVVNDGLVAAIWTVGRNVSLIAWQRLDEEWEMLTFPEPLLPVDLAVDSKGKIFVRWFHPVHFSWGYASLSINDPDPDWTLARAPCSDPDLAEEIWVGSYLTVYEGALLDITHPVDGVSVVSEIDF